MAALVYGDMLMLLSNQVKPYETEPGRAMALVEEWSRRLVAEPAAELDLILPGDLEFEE